MRKFLVILAAFAACSGASATSESRPASNGNDCLFTRSIRDFRPLDRNRLVIWGPGRRHAYFVELSAAGSDVRFAHRLAIVDRNHDGRLCGFGMDRIVVDDSSFSQPATILRMTRLDEEGLARLEAQYDVRLRRKSAVTDDAQ